MTKRNLSDVLGEYVGKSGNEERYYCLLCGSKALLLNHDKGVWFCHCCGDVGGRFDRTVVRSNYRDVTTTVDLRLVGDILTYRDVYTAAKELGCVGASVLPSKQIRGIPSEWLTKHMDCVQSAYSDLVIPLRQKAGAICGLQLYKPDSPFRYRTLGHRGVGSYTANLLEQPVDGIFLFEGMFDWLQMSHFLEHTKGLALKTCYLLYTAGDFISLDQLRIMGRHIYDICIPIFVCFDNDLISPPLKLMHKLKLLYDNNVHLLLPPKLEGVKDWDEFIRLYPKEAEALLKKELS